MAEPLKDITLQDQTPVERISGAAYTFANTYAYGNCTFGVATWQSVPDNLGNANTWVQQAMIDGYEISNTPKIGAVAQTSEGSLGHVALVTAVDVASGTVTVKEENYNGFGIVDNRTTPISDWTYIYFNV